MVTTVKVAMCTEKHNVNGTSSNDKDNLRIIKYIKHNPGWLNG